MSKEELTKNIHPESYRFKVQMLIERPKNKGIITKEEAKQLNGELFSIEYGSAQTSQMIRFYWVYDKEQNRVVSARYTIFGPPTLLAIADMAALLCRNKTPDEIANINYKSLEYFLRDNPVDPAISKERNFSITFILDALKYAVAKLKGEEIEESPIVCECANITKKSIEESIKEFDLKSTQDITDYTLAGAFCKECISSNRFSHPREFYIEDILKEVKEKLQKEQSKAAQIPDKPFKEMSIEEKREAINAVIDRHIRAMLVMDGGDMEILDIKNNGANTDIYIRYLGACSGCASASTGTLFAIEGILKQKLDPDIRVIPL